MGGGAVAERVFFGRRIGLRKTFLFAGQKFYIHWQCWGQSRARFGVLLALPRPLRHFIQETTMKWKLLTALCITLATVACGGNNATTPAAENSSHGNSAQPQKTGDKINWVSYTDSAEGAFSMDVPVGYEVQGGMYRFGYFDVRWMMEARSLDGKIIIRIDDVNVPPYSLPGPHTGTEGQRNFKPQQYQMITARYRDGQTYAESYAKHRFSSVCKTMNPRTADWKPTLPAEMRDDPGTRSTDGNVSYDCDTSDGPRIASVFVHSTLNSAGGLWFAFPVSVLSTPDRTAQAHSMVDRHDRQLEEKSGMGQRQNQITQEGLAHIGEDFGEFMKQMRTYHQQRTAAMNQQVAGYYARQNAQAEQVSGWGKTLTGLEDVRDPNTGAQFEIFSGPKSGQWINDAGTMVNSNLSPGPGYRLTTPVSH